MTAGVNGPADLATVPITFDGSIPLPPPPSLVVTPSTDLLDGQTVHVTGSGFDPDQQIGLAECSTGRSSARVALQRLESRSSPPTAAATSTPR